MISTLVHLVTSYGYWALLIGTFLEGETILVLAGFLAHRGYLAMPWVIAAALAGSFAGDQTFFFIGRLKGTAYLRKRPRWQKQADKASRLLQRHPLLIVLGFRFVYGMRTVTPLVIGVSAFPTWKFVLLNLIGAASWATAIACAGYLFGQTLQALLSDLHSYELLLAGLLVATGATIWLVRWVRSRRGS